MRNQQFVITKANARRTVAEVVRQQTHVSWSEVRRLVRTGQVQVNGQPCSNPDQRVTAGQQMQVNLPNSPPGKPRRQEPSPERTQEPVPEPTIRFTDAQIVVVDKPAGLTTMRHQHEAAEFGSRAKKFLPVTLADLLPGMLARKSPNGKPGFVRAVHRLDKETSGLVVFARSPAAERHLGQQFRAHTVERTYLALVRGPAKSERIETYLVDDRGDGRRGSGSKPGIGQRAVTHVRVLAELGEFTLVECKLETGRTHQVRIHLGERGTPLCGERLYDRPLHGSPLPDRIGAPRPMLHAASLGIEHPTTGKRLIWCTPLPSDMKKLLKTLRRRYQTRQPEAT